MFENEQVESGVNESPSPEVSAPESKSEAPVQAGSQAKPSESETTPFHEHPRFKELVEQKNRYAEQVKQFQAQMADMEKRFSQTAQPKPGNPMLERLKGIDPEFAKFQEELYGSKQELADLKAWKEQQQLDAIRTQAYSSINQLHEQNKVSPELRKLYESQIEFMVSKNPNAQLSDLPKIYQEVHSQYNTLLENTRRAERESYLAAKKGTSAVPTSQPKGKTVNPSDKKLGKLSSEDAKAEAIKSFTNQLRASKDL